MSQGMQAALESGEGKEMYFFLEPLEGMQLWRHLILVLTHFGLLVK